MRAGVAEAVAELGRTFPRERLLLDPERREPYGRDESDLGTFPPDAVVLVASAEEVQRTFAISARHRVPVIPVGARSGKSGGILATRGGIAVSVERMDRILEISAADGLCRVEPGLITARLQAEVEGRGLFYPPDPNSLELCSIGGNVAENAGGPRALKYGVTRDYVLGLTVVVPTGEVLRVGRRSIKGVAGYDLVGLFVGSEGTLGIITEITLELLPLPRQVATGFLTFGALADAARAVGHIVSSGVLPRCLELFDDISLTAVARTSPFRVPAGAGAALLVEVDGNDEEAVLGELLRIADAVRSEARGEMIVAQTEAQRRELWGTRRLLSQNLKAVHPLKLSEDVAVPRSKIPELITRAKEIGQRNGTFAATYGHAGDGNLHVNILFDTEAQRPGAERAAGEVLRTSVDLGGTITGEHGVGHSKREYLEYEQGPEVVAVERRLKALFDPLGLLNPGKIFVRDP
ncbi:MAG TPA: FAD-linked oxidase C-terminal domain-containing protein [Anaeromyxobacter sp.]|nr:FAD-linked oxidase C-terminal domain-containing protein [Anaeromyxobacter sp.]